MPVRNEETGTERTNEQSWSEMLQKGLWESANLLSKGFAFYLAIIAALLGYVLAQDLAPSIKRAILWFGVATSVFFFIALTVSVHGIVSVSSSLQDSMKRLHPQVFRSFGESLGFSKFRVAAWVFAVAALLIVAMLTAGMIMLLRQLPS